MPEDSEQRSLVGEVKYTTEAPRQRGSNAVAAPVRTMLVVPPSAMTPGRISQAAGRLGVSARQVQDLVDAGQPVPVQAGLRGERVRRELEDEPLEVEASSMPGLAMPALGVAGLLAGGGLIAIGAALTLLSSLAAIATVVVGGAVLLAAIVPFILWALQALAYRRTANTWRTLQEQAAQARSHPLCGEARTRLAAIRVHLSSAELPELAEVDIRSGLKEIEDDLLTLQRSWDQLPDGPAGDEARERLQLQVTRVEIGLTDLRNFLTQASMEASGEAGDALRDTIAAAQLAVDGLPR